MGAAVMKNPTRARNQRIYEYTLIHPDKSAEDVALKFKTTPRQVENIVKTERVRQSPRPKRPRHIREHNDVAQRVEPRVRERIATMKAVGDGPEQIQWRLKVEMDVSVTLEFIQSV